MSAEWEATDALTLAPITPRSRIFLPTAFESVSPEYPLSALYCRRTSSIIIFPVFSNVHLILMSTCFVRPPNPIRDNAWIGPRLSQNHGIPSSGNPIYLKITQLNIPWRTPCTIIVHSASVAEMVTDIYNFVGNPVVLDRLEASSLDTWHLHLVVGIRLLATSLASAIMPDVSSRSFSSTTARKSSLPEPLLSELSNICCALLAWRRYANNLDLRSSLSSRNT